MEMRRLGRLGVEVSVLAYGAAALGEVDQDTADASIQEALDGGITYLDVAASYGEAELRLGPWIPQIRDRVFLATKTGVRDAEGAWAQINASLERLRTDHVDLIQLHAVGTIDELDLCTGPGGALESALRAVDEGLAGAVGITGHGPTAAATHLEALRRHPFATVISPLNVALWRDPGFRDAFTALADEVRRQDAALVTIKTVARRNWPGTVAGEKLPPQQFATWYEPWVDDERIRAAVSWSLSRPEVSAIPTAGDVRLLRAIIAAEADRMDAAQAEAMLADAPEYSSPFLAMPA